jgi:hypothetical protein
VSGSCASRAVTANSSTTLSAWDGRAGAAAGTGVCAGAGDGVCVGVRGDGRAGFAGAAGFRRAAGAVAGADVLTARDGESRRAAGTACAAAGEGHDRGTSPREPPPQAEIATGSAASDTARNRRQQGANANGPPVEERRQDRPPGTAAQV